MYVYIKIYYEKEFSSFCILLLTSQNCRLKTVMCVTARRGRVRGTVTVGLSDVYEAS